MYFKSEPVYEGRLKVILLLQVSSHDIEPTFIVFCLNWRILPDQSKPLTRNKHLSLLYFWPEAKIWFLKYMEQNARTQNFHNIRSFKSLIYTTDEQKYNEIQWLLCQLCQFIIKKKKSYFWSWNWHYEN